MNGKVQLSGGRVRAAHSLAAARKSAHIESLIPSTAGAPMDESSAPCRGLGGFGLGWVHVEVVKVVGSATGIAGAALGLVLRRYETFVREKFFPEMQPHQAYTQLRLITASLFMAAAIGACAALYVTVAMR
jgi:hypothetical protein